jgi:SAM-dependent methyltransferase
MLGNSGPAQGEVKMRRQRERRRFDHFGIIAPIYERVIAPPDADRLRALLELREGDCLLDVGGGTGRVAKHLDPFPCPAWVLDLSLGMLREARGQRLVPCRAVAEGLPFADGAFSRIVAVDSFHHFHDQGAAAREMLRVLAPGGRLVVEEPDIRRFVVKLVALGERLALMRSHFRPPEDVMDLLRTQETEVHCVADAPNYWVVVQKAG